MLMKKEYFSPEISLVMFDNEDIIVTSNVFDMLLENEKERNPDLGFSELFGG